MSLKDDIGQAVCNAADAYVGFRNGAYPSLVWGLRCGELYQLWGEAYDAGLKFGDVALEQGRLAIRKDPRFEGSTEEALDKLVEQTLETFSHSVKFADEHCDDSKLSPEERRLLAIANNRAPRVH